jgi:hypothetical protein
MEVNNISNGCRSNLNHYQGQRPADNKPSYNGYGNAARINNNDTYRTNNKKYNNNSSNYNNRQPNSSNNWRTLGNGQPRRQ